ncbi:MAG: methylenetetrahydrofolate--tRNA-(uracil(54)-C(5))-methyltransferase (FADH(2)-oxidizing) TrmFO [Clostridia bacterium]|jgi:methylenetetrahydrofolate--tRNA-(uracil-5-)-methyltransferase
MNRAVHVIGAGLAGCEATWQLVKRGIPVILHEMRPVRFTPAHQTHQFAELVCSNSLRSDRLENAVGLLKAEMRILDSLIIKSADAHRVPAGSALAVDRQGYSRMITECIQNHPLVEVMRAEVTEIPKEDYCIIATGPLTSDKMAASIQELLQKDYLYFYDAAAPIVTYESLDMSKIYRASRYGRGDDYLNCPMTEEEYIRFWSELVKGETVPVKDFEDEKVFEGCMPIEVMAKRGKNTLVFGPLKPVGLPHPETGQEPYGVVQLRQDNMEGTLYNLVGFQTHLRFAEQKRIFRLIPGLENAEFVRYGVMHRNTYIHSPGVLNHCYQLKKDPRIFFAGQITGVEGYVGSAASGMLAGISMALSLKGKDLPDFTRETAIGALGYYIAESSTGDFQPMNINFGIMAPLKKRFRKKQERNLAISQRALEKIAELSKVLV